ncbi:MAG: ABC transporter ATP-binding protein [Lachnospiraceae bacterium]|jgi:ABC-2 type transport system ATP-binding protein|nr:ABC transporter ATP-binding protein [Lachnospiraceae bacterium]
MQVKIEGITKKLGQREVLNNISFVVPDNKCVGLIGPNGAGKTTILRLILGLYIEDRGRVLFDDKKREQLNLADPDTCITFLLDASGLMRLLTVRENIEFYHRFYCRNESSDKRNEEIDNILKRINLYDYRNAGIKELSRGMKQRLSIGKTMVAHPRFFVMDEPYLGLDVEAQIFLSDYIQELKASGCTILISAHDLGHLEKICDEAVFIKNGTIVAHINIPADCKRDYLEDLYKEYIIEGKG